MKYSRYPSRDAIRNYFPLPNEIVQLGKERFFHADYEATLRSVYGKDSDADSLVVEGGKL